MNTPALEILEARKNANFGRAAKIIGSQAIRGATRDPGHAVNLVSSGMGLAGGAMTIVPSILPAASPSKHDKPDGVPGSIT